MLLKFSRIDVYMAGAILLSIIFRLIAMPFSMTTEADAVSRIFMAIEWIQKPYLISSGVWGPLHTYLIAGILFIWNNPIYAPILLNIFFSAAVAIPLYFFVKREWNENAGLFTTCIYLIYPVAIRNSLMALSEIPFIFFVTLTLLFLSFAMGGKNNWKYAFMAGIFLTLAASLRYEAWVLIPALGIILWKRWKSFLVFLFASMLFPVFWMSGNYIQYGDPLYGTDSAINWQINISHVNNNLRLIDLINRAIFFPQALFFGITPLAFLVCLAGIILVIFKHKKQQIWLIPLVVLFVFYMVSVINGTLALHVRYSLTLAILLIPFAAEWYVSLKLPYNNLFHLLLIASILPMSFIEWKAPFPILVGEEIHPIPQLNQQAVNISKFEIAQGKSFPGGLLLDFFGWENTYYVALMSQQGPENIFIMPGGTNEALNIYSLNEFLGKNPTGIILLTKYPRFMQIDHQSNGIKLSFLGNDKKLSAKLLGNVEDISFYSYSISP